MYSVAIIKEYLVFIKESGPPCESGAVMLMMVEVKGHQQKVYDVVRD